MIQTREEFLDERRHYLGATDIAAILGVDNYKTPLDVFNEKLGLVAPFEGNRQTERGQKLEDVAAREYMEVTGRKVHKRSTILTHPEHDFIRGHVDRRVVGDKRPVEIKCPSRGMFYKIKREGLPNAWILQMQTYLWLDRSEVGDFAPFCADSWEILPFEVAAQPEIFEQIEVAAVTFWTQHVLKRTPPPPLSADKPALEFAAVPGEVTFREDKEFAGAAQLLREAKQLERDGKELYEIAKGRIKDVLGHKFGKYQGEGLRLSYYMSPGLPKLDKKRLAAEHPEIKLSDYENRGEAFEVLKPIFIGDN
jgi:putative phage-type endonuclease